MAHSSVSASVSSSPVRLIPEAPEAIATTVSLVDMQASESTRLKVMSHALARESWNSSGSTIASVVRKTSIVASCGASIPAPLAIPPNRAPPASTVAIFGTVSVVIIARAAEASALSPLPRARWIVLAPTRMDGMSSLTPMTPVEAITTSCGLHSRRVATCSASH